jgi:hypothetical protein
MTPTTLLPRVHVIIPRVGSWRTWTRMPDSEDEGEGEEESEGEEEDKEESEAEGKSFSEEDEESLEDEDTENLEMKAGVGG